MTKTERQYLTVAAAVGGVAVLLVWLFGKRKVSLPELAPTQIKWEK